MEYSGAFGMGAIFSPDVIFFAAGDYAFPYRIALRLSALLHIPIVMWCADDFI